MHTLTLTPHYHHDDHNNDKDDDDNDDNDGVFDDDENDPGGASPPANDDAVVEQARAPSFSVSTGAGYLSLNTGNFWFEQDKTMNFELTDFPNLRTMEFELEDFSNLTYLNCSGNQIDSLDFSQNLNLTYLNCSGWWFNRNLLSLNNAM